MILAAWRGPRGVWRVYIYGCEGLETEGLYETEVTGVFVSIVSLDGYFCKRAANVFVATRYGHTVPAGRRAAPADPWMPNS